MITADALTNEMFLRLLTQIPEEDWELFAVGLIRAGFELAVECAELCHEAQCTHDRVESHLNWTDARRALNEECAEILAARSRGPK